MTEKNPMAWLKQLESTLRANSERTGWLYLEPIDDELLETVQNVLASPQMEREAPPDVTPQKTLLNTASRIGDI